MQKYTIPLILILILVLTAREINKTVHQFNLNNILSSEDAIKPTPTPLRLPNGYITETVYSGIKYLILWIKVPLKSKISLIPNFKERIFGDKLTDVNDCDLGINGGFYLGSEAPLGLFVTNGKIFGTQLKSNIANTFVWQDKAGDLKFVRSAPESFGFTDFIFQTGPYIIPRNVPLNLVRDERARRSLLGKDSQGNLYFISVANKENLVGGPHLADIPIIFWELKQKNILPFEELVNLDGGSASFFHSKDETGNLTLTSWAPIGSLLCVKFSDLNR